nr:hypothetical protein [Thiomonas sp. FB-6]
MAQVVERLRHRLRAIQLKQFLTSSSRTARCGPARRVVWQGRGSHEPPPMPMGGTMTQT